MSVDWRLSWETVAWGPCKRESLLVASPGEPGRNCSCALQKKFHSSIGYLHLWARQNSQAGECTKGIFTMLFTRLLVYFLVTTTARTSHVQSVFFWCTAAFGRTTHTVTDGERFRVRWGKLSSLDHRPMTATLHMFNMPLILLITLSSGLYNSLYYRTSRD